jgi:hypothetical protein
MFERILQQLQNRTPPAPLFPTQAWQPELSHQVEDADDKALFGTSAGNDEQREMRAACRAGLLLLNDDLEASHKLSQQINSRTGAFWHAIMHRREGDFSNANHWLARTGIHPAFDDVYTAAMSALLSEDEKEAGAFARDLEDAGTWTPQEFVALCENAGQQNSEPGWLRGLQRAEMIALLNWCHERV